MFNNKSTKNDLIYLNEIQANRLSAKTMFLFAIIMIPNFFLTYFKILGEKSNTLPYFILISIIILIIPFIIVVLFDVQKLWIKYLILTILVILSSIFHINSAAAFTISWVSAIAFAALYFSPSLSIYVLILLLLFQSISEIISVYLDPKFFVGTWYNRMFSIDSQLII